VLASAARADALRAQLQQLQRTSRLAELNAKSFASSLAAARALGVPLPDASESDAPDGAALTVEALAEAASKELSRRRALRGAREAASSARRSLKVVGQGRRAEE
jgi:hypothetical protein